MEWAVQACKEGAEPAEFWAAIGGKQAYETGEASASCSGGFEPRLFYCSDETGAFKVDEVFDFSQEDIEQDQMYILDVWSAVFVWVGKDAKSNEQASGLEVAKAYTSLQGALDGRPSGVAPQIVFAGKEPKSFTMHFVGWSDKYADEFEDPYEKRQRMLAEKAANRDPNLDDPDELPAMDEVAAPGTPIPLAEIIKRTASRNGGLAPPVAALPLGEIVLSKNAAGQPVPAIASARSPSVPKLEIAKLPGVNEASSLDSARRRASAAMAAGASLAAAGEQQSWDDPQTQRYTLEEIRDGEASARINPLCKELYLQDGEFQKIFGMDKEQFWKQAHWKQRAAKKKAGLF